MTDADGLEPRHFIPFRRVDLVAMLRAGRPLPGDGEAQFSGGLARIEGALRDELYALGQGLKDAYAPVDPDADTRVVEGLATVAPGDLSGLLEQALTRGNYDRVEDAALQKALRSSSLFQVSLEVDLDDYDEVLLYTRGASRREETLREFFGLWRRRVSFTNFEREVLYLRLKDDIDSDSALGECPPGSTMLRLFQNVPEADLEMLFPNIRIGMRLLDKLMIGVPALVSGGIVFTTKLGTTLLLLGSLFGFWLGLSSERVELDRPALLALAAGLGALGGYLWKQFSNFRTRKLRYTQALTENLYFKLLDNNAGVLYRLLDDALKSECKESLLAYHFLLAAQAPLTVSALDRQIEEWFASDWQCELDFDVEDALGKLERLGLAQRDGEAWAAVTHAAIETRA